MVNRVARSSQLYHSTVTGRASHPYGRANPTSSSTAASFFSNEGRIVASLVAPTYARRQLTHVGSRPVVGPTPGASPGLTNPRFDEFVVASTLMRKRSPRVLNDHAALCCCPSSLRARRDRPAHRSATGLHARAGARPPVPRQPRRGAGLRRRGVGVQCQRGAQHLVRREIGRAHV